MNKEKNLMEQIKKESASLSECFSAIGTIEEAMFDSEIAYRLTEINELAKLVPHYRDELMKQCFELSGMELDRSIIMKHTREKPFGYSGDFQLIDWIYKNEPCSQGKGWLWDKVFLRQPATQAVRNRVNFFGKQLYFFCKNHNKTSVLSLACGPCREVLDAVRAINPGAFNCSFHFVDQDSRAIDYAKSLINGDFSHSLELQWEASNVFRIRPKQKYSLIWVSGLFDYLDDRLAAALLRRMWHWLDNGGRIIVGNFHPDNPSRNQMEWCLGWFLIHRSENEMTELCRKARISTEAISFEFEPVGINMFLVINKG